MRLVTPAKLTDQFPKSHSVESIKNSIGMTLNLIPAGEFFMGSPDDAIEAEGRETLAPGADQQAVLPGRF